MFTSLRCFFYKRLLPAAIFFVTVIVAPAQVNVLTYHFDNFRTGQNVAERALNLENVNSATFGKLFAHSVDGQIYAQPLELQKVQIAGSGQHNVVFVATEHDSVYAFDADSNTGANANPLWQVSFIDPPNGITPIPADDIGVDFIYPEVGITSTPVIDATTGTLYVVADTKENGAYFQRLHALDVTSGAEKFGGPVEIQATVAGTGWGSQNGHISFDPLHEHQRAALLLSHGIVYIAWSSHGKESQYIYHGWVMGYDAKTLTQVAVFNDTPNGKQGGIWAAGGGLTTGPNGNLFVVTGNGTFDVDQGGIDYGESFVNLTPDLQVADYFSPYDEGELSDKDRDLGGGEAMIVPGPNLSAPPHLGVGAGKGGTIYLVDLRRLGGFNPSQNENLETIENAFAGNGMLNSPGYWQQKLYFCASKDVLRIFQINNGLISPNPIATSQHVFTQPGATSVISANGAKDGIVWLLEYITPQQNQGYGGPAVLHAFDATNATEIYNSNQAGSRDVPGNSLHFIAPIVANGKVYLGTANELDVFGLLGNSRSLNGHAVVPTGADHRAKR